MNSLPCSLSEVRNLAAVEFDNDKNGTLAAVVIKTSIDGLPEVYVNRDLVIKTISSAKREGLMD